MLKEKKSFHESNQCNYPTTEMKFNSERKYFAPLENKILNSFDFPLTYIPSKDKIKDLAKHEIL